MKIIEKIYQTIDIEVFWNRMNCEFRYVGINVDLYRQKLETAFKEDKQWVVDEWIENYATPQELKNILFKEMYDDYTELR